MLRGCKLSGVAASIGSQIIYHFIAFETLSTSLKNIKNKKRKDMEIQDTTAAGLTLPNRVLIHMVGLGYMNNV